jgi:hypothetical protein
LEVIAAEEAAPCCGGYCLPEVFSEYPSWHWLARMLVFPLLTIGRVPLFFYIVHWWLLGVLALIVHAASDGIPLRFLPLFWLALLVTMFIICAPYVRFKHRKGIDSLWRFL